MDPAIKKVAILLAAALVVVIGLIVLTSGTDAKKADVATVETKVEVAAQQTEEKTAPTAQEPDNEAAAIPQETTDVAQIDNDAQSNEMYEGALAGLSEEEIAKMAMAEEQSAARTDTTTGAEDAID
jgi:hypothetical protein